MKKESMWERYVDGAACALRLAIGSPDYRYGGSYRRYDRQAVGALKCILPYCLHPLRAGDDAPLIWLNREYKPLGIDTYSEWVDYNEFTWLHVAIDDPKIAALLKECRHVRLFSDGNPAFYLRNDASSPTNGKEHARRLLRLLELALGRSSEEEDA